MLYVRSYDTAQYRHILLYEDKSQSRIRPGGLTLRGTRRRVCTPYIIYIINYTY